MTIKLTKTHYVIGSIILLVIALLIIFRKRIFRAGGIAGAAPGAGGGVPGAGAGRPSGIRGINVPISNQDFVGNITGASITGAQISGVRKNGRVEGQIVGTARITGGTANPSPSEIVIPHTISSLRTGQGTTPSEIVIPYGPISLRTGQAPPISPDIVGDIIEASITNARVLNPNIVNGRFIDGTIVGGQVNGKLTSSIKSADLRTHSQIEGKGNAPDAAGRVGGTRDAMQGFRVGSAGASGAR